MTTTRTTGRILSALLLTGLAAGCGSSPPKADHDVETNDGTTSAADEAFTARAEAFYTWSLENNPQRAAGLGYHDYDGKLEDISRETLERLHAETVAWLADFNELRGLSVDREYERQIIIHNVRGAIFDVEVLRSPWRNPMGYAGALGLDSYISRDYAPASGRARSMIEICSQAPAYYAEAQKNLEKAMPRTMLETALLIITGTMSFINKDIIEAMADLPDDEKKALKTGLAGCTSALAGFKSFLEARRADATDDFAIGEAAFLRMLSDSEGLDITMERLEAIGKADLERNLAALDAAADKLAPGKGVSAAVTMTSTDKPAPGAVLAEATAQADQMKQFLVDKEIVSIPSQDVAETRATPPFMRWNFAFLSTPGAFETKALPSFYYISPPDPSWPKKTQEDYVASRSDLLFVTVHEVWPGHFLHYLHAKRSPSKIARSFCNYSMSEGWAHYTEEMMWDAGVGDGDPRVHIGQLQNALLRNVRYISAIGLHTKGMTVDESRQLFIDKGYQDEGNATQQATRGTFDPGYLNYTLGKLMIRKLHDDWKDAQGDAYSLKRFHDQFLRYQCAPVPVIRQLMLGDSKGAAL